MPPLLRSIITPLLALALAPTVAAQSPWLPPVVQMDPSVGATLARTDASISQVRDAARAAYRPTPTTGVSTLESFSLTFLKSAHKIRRRGVLDPAGDRTGRATHDGAAAERSNKCRSDRRRR